MIQKLPNGSIIQPFLWIPNAPRHAGMEYTTHHHIKNIYVWADVRHGMLMFGNGHIVRFAEKLEMGIFNFERQKNTSNLSLFGSK